MRPAAFLDQFSMSGSTRLMMKSLMETRSSRASAPAQTHRILELRLVTCEWRSRPARPADCAYSSINLLSDPTCAALGMPGCYANVSVDIVIPSSNAGGYGVLQLRVPISTALIARDVYLQAMVRDPLLSGLGFAFSTGFAATLGLP